MPVFSTLFLRRAVLLTGWLLANTLIGQAQVPDNGGTAGGPPAPGAAAVPLDGGASLLLAGGIGLALLSCGSARRKLALH